MAEFPVIDGHNDILLHYYQSGADIKTFFAGEDNLQIDLPRARQGGLAAGFFAVFAPQEETADFLKDFGPDKVFDLPAVEHDYAQQVAMAMVATLYRMEAASDGRFKVTRTVEEVEPCLRDNVMAAILHFEGAEPIDTDLNALEVFYQAGLRSLGLVWSRPTAFAHGVPYKFNHSPDTGPGLTAAGKTLVRACNELNIMVDLSHLNEKGFWDVAAISDAPLVATHSNAHVLCPSTRNLTDKQLDAIKERDGMVGLNFFVGMLREDGKNDGDTPLTTMVRHVDHLVERVGIDRVGFGADMSLLDITVPDELGDISGLPKLIDALRAAGYDDESLRKITHQNWLRVLRQTWKAQ
jgi:membrane dipeptidase